MEQSGREGMAEHSDLHIEADAVCEQCSTVNPAGTLLCKSCGNNLRDQRTRRLSAAGPVIPMEDTGRPRRLLAGLLTVLGLLVILWVAFNVTSIEAMLTRGFEETSDAADPESLWNSSAASVYDDLAKELAERPITELEQQMALTQSNLSTGFDGRYVLKRSEEPFAPVIGYAIVKTQGESVFFDAVVLRENEFRGEARVMSSSLLQADLVGVKTPNAYLEAYGVGQVSPGKFDCRGYTTATEETPFEVIAYHVPEMPGGAPVTVDTGTQ